MKWFDKLFCKMGSCRKCLPSGDEKACWCECRICGKKAAYLDRRIISSYMDLQDAHKRHKELVKRVELEEMKNN